MGCHTEPAAVHIAHVLQMLHFFQLFIFFIIYTTYRKNKKIALPYRKNKKNQFFFYNSYDLQQKKITRLDGFFVHGLHFSPSKCPSQRGI